MIFMHSQPLEHNIPDQHFTQRFRQPLQQLPLNLQNEMRKKIQNYSFLLSEQIGKGYSSKVYKGLDDLTGEEVAIKVIELKSLRDHTSRTMLHTQIQCFKEVSHPNVLQYHNSYFTANNCYIITEYCPGGDLAKLMKQRGKIHEKEASAMFLQIFQAYKAFYQAGYVHRDIKPANIFLGKDGGLRLADFGFSKKRTHIDRQNYNVGTPIYMPRQSLAANIYNEKTDLWALGITLYEMLFGEVPFKGRTEQELRNNIETGVIRFPENVQVSQQIKDFIYNCLLNDSMKRMGVKQMEKHQWLSPMLSKGQKGADSAEKIKEQKDLRISLPHDGVLHSKSRQYFDSKQNRRSSSSTQKLKLCMPRKGSQILPRNREPLGEKILNYTEKQYSDVQNQENRPQNQNRQSNSVNKSLRQTVINEPSKAKSNASVGIEKVVSLINYFRLLYRLLDKVNQAQADVSQRSIKTQLEKAGWALTDRVVEIFRKHMTSVLDRSNQFALSSDVWISFATSERWQMYEFVIGRYKAKYSDLLSKSSSVIGRWESSSLLFVELWATMEKDLPRLLLRQRYLCVQILGLVSHLCTLQKLIQEKGWEAFANKYSNNQAVLMESYIVNLDNFEEIYDQMKEVYSTIQHNLLLRFQ